MRETIKFSWRDPETGLVHVMRAEIELTRSDRVLGANVRTLCGFRLGFIPHPEFSSTPVTCALCQEGDWLPRLIALLPPPRRGQRLHGTASDSPRERQRPVQVRTGTLGTCID